MTRFVTLAIAVVAAVAAFAQPKAVDRAVWKAAVEAEHELEIRGSFITPAGVTWMIAASKPTAQFTAPQIATELVGVDASGRQIARLDLTALLGTANISSFHGVAVTGNDEVVVFATTAAGDLFAYSVVPDEGRLAGARRLGGSRRDHYIAGVVPAEDGRLLLVGRSGDRGWMMKLDATLAVRWEKSFEDEPVTAVVDAAVRRDGGIVAAGTQILPDGQAKVWIGRLSSEGQPLARQQFAGRFASVAVAADDRIAVVHDTKGAAGWDVILRGLSPTLVEEWSAPVTSGARIPPQFEVAATSTGEWIAAGPKEKRLWVAAWGTGGQLLWGYTVPQESAEWERLWNVGQLAVREGTVVMPFTLLTLDDEKQQRQRIRVLKLPVRGR